MADSRQRSEALEAAVGAAHRLAHSGGGDTTVRPEHLLIAMLRERDAGAARLLVRLQVSPGTLEQDLEAAASRDEDTAGELLARAELEAEAEGPLESLHVLRAALRVESTAGRVLAAHGVTRERVQSELARLEQTGTMDLTRDGRAALPAVVGWVSFYLGVQCLCSFGNVAFPYNRWTLGREFYLVGSLLHVLFYAAMIAPLRRRKQWAWAAVTGSYFVRCGTLAAGIAWMLQEAFTSSRPLNQRPNSVAFFMWEIFLCVQVILTTGLFGARGWYGIRPREGWRVMLRQGWWAMLLGTVFGFGQLVVWALMRG